MLLCKKYGAGLEEKTQPCVLECLGLSSQVTAKYKGKVEQFSETILDVLKEVVPLSVFLILYLLIFGFMPWSFLGEEHCFPLMP